MAPPTSGRPKKEIEIKGVDDLTLSNARLY
jgi:hypothetical protein